MKPRPQNSKKSGHHSSAEKTPFSVYPEFSDLTPTSKLFSVVFDGYFETISEQRRGISILR